MNNQSTSFANVPRIKHARSKFFCPSSHKTTFNAGKLVPLYVDEVLPGDTYDIDMSAVLRSITPLAPVMDNAYLDLYAFFVPNRLVWQNWENFISTPTPEAYTSPVEYTVPMIKFSGLGVERTYDATLRGTFWDYVGVGSKTGSLSVASMPALSALYPRAYVKIWNDWFRDENLQSYAHLYTDDVTRNFVATFDAIVGAEYGGYLLPVGKYKDYFTSALPAPQKHPAVMLPLAGSAPVNNSSVDKQFFSPTWYDSSGIILNSGNALHAGGLPGSGSIGTYISPPLASGTPVQSLLSLSADLSSATSVSINQMRLAFQTQRFYEQLARGGSRYTEVLQSMFNVYASDARLQRAEFLGGKRIPVKQYQVAQTAEGSENGATIGLGDTGAFSFTADGGSRMCHKSFTEHGLIFVLGCVRTDQTYAQGISCKLTRSTRFDYYFPVFAHIGEQPIYNREIYVQGSAADDTVFGYKEPWAEYRYDESRVSCGMRPQVEKNFGIWTYANNFTTQPSLSPTFIVQDTAAIDRTLAVPSSTSDQFFGDFYFKTYKTRVMPLYGVPGLIDHD